MTVELILGDCLDVMRGMPDKSVDAVITDPPYPDYYAEEYKYFDGLLEPLNKFDCRQLIFWSAKVEFPLDYTAIHIWDKRAGGLGSFYEKIYERNGNKEYRMFNFISINNSVRAQFAQDKLFGHKSQKPIKLMIELINRYTNPGDTILDPFMGSGTTGVACVQTGRNFIGIEIDEGYYKIAEKRIHDAQQQPNLFEAKTKG